MEERTVNRNGPGRYIITKEINRGSFGEVYLAVDPKTKQEFAVKYVKEEAKEAYKEALFLTMANTDDVHGFVVKFHAMYEEEDRPHLVMDLIRGGDLGSWASRLGAVPLQEFKVITKRMFGIFEFLGAKGIVHGDVKPNNFLLASEDPASLKVCDFGLAVQVPSENTLMNYRRLGTPSYRAPEVTLGYRTWYAMSPDIWAVGCVLLGLALRTHLFPVRTVDSEDQARAEDVLYQVCRKVGKLPEHMILGAKNQEFCEFLFQDLANFPESPEPLRSYLLDALFGCPGWDQDEVLLLFELIRKSMTMDPDTRIRPCQALKEPFLHDV